MQNDPLVDRDCVLLDGNCKCLKPMEDCKYLQSPIVYIREQEDFCDPPKQGATPIAKRVEKRTSDLPNANTGHPIREYQHERGPSFNGKRG